MAKIFLSYASEDRDRVLPIVEALEDDGFTLWWDRQIRPGPSFDREIEKALDEAACVVVLWSAHAVDSEWVRSEVEEGARRNILVPALIDEDVLPPLAYRRRQAALLCDWQGERDGEYAKLLTGIRALLDRQVSADPPAGGAQAETPVRKRALRRLRLRRLPLQQAVGVALVLAAVGVVLGWWLGLRQAPVQGSATVVQFEVPYPEGTSRALSVLQPMAIMPDGQALVFITDTLAGGSQYLARYLDDPQPRPIGVPAGRLGSIWAAGQGGWLVYNDVAADTWRKVRLDGGAPVAVVDANAGVYDGVRGVAWGPDGRIVYASGSAGLMVVPAAGGTPEVLTTPKNGLLHRRPTWTPDGRAVVYAETGGDPGTRNDLDATIHVVDVSSGASKALLAGVAPRVTSSGHLLLMRDGMLWATVFDADGMGVVGEPVPVMTGLADGVAAYDIADNGTLVYVPVRNDRSAGTELVWLGLDGTVEPLDLDFPDIGFPRVSPDGKSILMTVYTGSRDRPEAQGLNIAHYALDTGRASKVTYGPQRAVAAEWLGDSRRFLFAFLDDGLSGALHLGYADGARPPEALGLEVVPPVRAVAAEENDLVYSRCQGANSCRVMRRASPDAEPEVLLESSSTNDFPEPSPDGRMLAYLSDASGRSEIYLRPFPDVGTARVQVSVNGGAAALWSRDGRLLYFVEPAGNRLMVVDVTAGGVPEVSAPRPVLDLTGYEWGEGPSGHARNFDLDADGQRLLAIRRRSAPAPFVVVLNWFSELERQVPIR